MGALWVVSAQLRRSASLLQPPIDSAASFYLLPFRVWQFALGALALEIWRMYPLTEFSRQISRSLGLALCGISIVTFSENTAFPGLASLCPKCGCGACSDECPRDVRKCLAVQSTRTMAWTTVLRTLLSSLAADRTLPPLFSNRANAGDNGGSCAGYPHLSAGLALRRRAAVLSPRS